MSYDQLTKCFSREYLFNNFSNYKSGYVIYIDIDDFKTINDTYGHTVGDDYLVIFSSRIIEILPEDSFLARLGGDEFCIILSIDCNITIFLDKLIKCIKTKIATDDYVIYPSYSIGVVEYPKFSPSLEDNLAFADIAMYDIKKTSKNSYKIFCESEYNMYQKKKAYKDPLINALDNGSIFLNICPRYFYNQEGSKKLHSFIAKVTWNYDGEIISDIELFRIAEFLGLGTRLSKYLLLSLASYIETFKFSLNNGVPIVISIRLTKENHFHILHKFYKILLEKNISKNCVVFKTTYTSLIKLQKTNQILYNKLVQNNIGVEIIDSNDLRLNALASDINIFSVSYTHSDISKINFEIIRSLLDYLNITMITPKELCIYNTVVEDTSKAIEANFYRPFVEK